MNIRLGLALLVLALAGCASTGTNSAGRWQGETVYWTNAKQVDLAPRPGLGVVVNRSPTFELTVLVFPGRYALEGPRDGLLVPDPQTGKLQLVRGPIHRFTLGSAVVREAPPEYWLWLPPERDYTFLVLIGRGALFGLSPWVLGLRVHHVHPPGRVFDQRYTRVLGNMRYFVDWKLEITG